MTTEARRRDWWSWALATALAALMAAAVYWVWRRVELPMLGREDIWFSLGWFFLLAAPAALRLFQRSASPPEGALVMQGDLPSRGAFLFGGLFIALLLAGSGLGNYKLWLGVVYLGGVTLRLAGLTLELRGRMLGGHERDLLNALWAAAITSLAGLLLIPWVEPGITAHWPPDARELFSPIAASLLWGGVTGAVLLAWRALGGNERSAWLAYLAVGLGPGPALAVSWFKPVPLVVALIVLVGIIILKHLGAKAPEVKPREPRPLSLYWLWRALMILWWGLGVVVALEAAWWQPQLSGLFAHSIWLRAILLGAFLVVCVGVLAEYSLPLLGRSPLVGMGRARKLLGVMFSSLALLAALSPLLMAPLPKLPAPPSELMERARAEILTSPVTLKEGAHEVTLKLPAWLTGVSHIFVISRLTNADQVKQGSPVAQLVATDNLGLPHIFPLRAGIDTAGADLEKREVALEAQHQSARIADSWIEFSPTGEAFTAHDYYTGLYLGLAIERLTSVRIRSLALSNPEGAPVQMIIDRVFVY